jgi:ribulose-phosphate 3-epimerase
MVEIIPTILVKKFSEVKERIKAVEKYVNWVQLDIMDGIFVANETWCNPADLKNFQTKAKLEAHLMIQNPEEAVDDWLKVVDRVIVHFESKISDLTGLIRKIHNGGKQIGLAINPETHFSVVAPFLKDLDLVLFMTVQPGWGGQKFRDEVLVKIKSLREIWPNGNIEVD